MRRRVPAGHADEWQILTVKSNGLLTCRPGQSALNLPCLAIWSSDLAGAIDVAAKDSPPAKARAPGGVDPLGGRGGHGGEGASADGD